MMIHGPHQELEAQILNDGSDDFFEQIRDYLGYEEATIEINRRYPGFDEFTINGVIRAIKECE